MENIKRKFLYIGSQRQRRAFLALSRSDVSSLNLRKIAGVLNAPLLVAGLREIGWEIWCRRVKRHDQDGKSCMPGIYWMSNEMKELAVGILSGDSVEAAPTDSTEVSSKACDQRVARGEENG